MSDLEKCLKQLQMHASVKQSLKLRQRMLKSNEKSRSSLKYGRNIYKTQGNQKKSVNSVIYLPSSFGKENKSMSTTFPRKEKQSNSNGRKVVRKSNHFSKQMKQKSTTKSIYDQCLAPPIQTHKKARKLSKFQKLKTETNAEIKKKKKCINYYERPSLALKSTADDFDFEDQYLLNKYKDDQKGEKQFKTTKKCLKEVRLHSDVVSINIQQKMTNKKIDNCLSVEVAGLNKGGKNIEGQLLEQKKQEKETKGVDEICELQLYEKQQISNKSVQNSHKTNAKRLVFFKSNQYLASHHSIGPNQGQKQGRKQILPDEELQNDGLSKSKLIFKKSLNFQTVKSLKTLNRIKSTKSLASFNFLQGDRGQQVGKGNFGRVWKLNLVEEKLTIAVKKIDDFKGIKEFEIMKVVSGHPFVADVYDAYHSSKHSGYQMEIFMPFYESGDLQNKIYMEGTINFGKVKLYAYQILRGIHYIHSQQIIHRDIKADNIFLHKNNLVIGDFGISKFFNGRENNFCYVCKRFNRAPQLLLKNSSYDYKIDIWAAGCVIVEMILGRPLFESTNSQDLLIEIIRVFGSPTTSELKDTNKEQKKNLQHIVPPNVKKKTWSQILEEESLCPNLCYLLEKMFEFSPKNRISAIEALKLPYFDDLREEQNFIRMQQRYKIKDEFFVFWEDEIDADERRILVPNWFVKRQERKMRQNMINQFN